MTAKTTAIITAPAVSTVGATSVGSTGGTLNGTVTPNLVATTYWFEYGASSSLTGYTSTASNTLTASASVANVWFGLTGLTRGMTYYYRVAASNAGGTTRGSILSFTTGTQAAAGALRFVPITPCRMVDTRNANGPLSGPAIASGGTRDFAPMNSSCGIPWTAAAYSLNVAVVPQATLGYLTVWPAGLSATERTRSL